MNIHQAPAKGRRELFAYMAIALSFLIGLSCWGFILFKNNPKVNTYQTRLESQKQIEDEIFALILQTHPDQKLVRKYSAAHIQRNEDFNTFRNHNMLSLFLLVVGGCFTVLPLLIFTMFTDSGIKIADRWFNRTNPRKIIGKKLPA